MLKKCLETLETLQASYSHVQVFTLMIRSALPIQPLFFVLNNCGLMFANLFVNIVGFLALILLVDGIFLALVLLVFGCKTTMRCMLTLAFESTSRSPQTRCDVLRLGRFACAWVQNSDVVHVDFCFFVDIVIATNTL